MKKKTEFSNSYYDNALKEYSHYYIAKKQASSDNKKLKSSENLYVIYARKSTEDEKRQVQSIDDQIEHCQNYAKYHNLNVVDIIREEKSAHTAGKRERFLEMIETLRRGDSYNSILAWHPDRLSRNMKESGEILDLLDNGVIQDLKFDSYVFNNDAAGKMTLSILFAMAKEFSDKLSEDTKRGISKKIKQGLYCGSPKKGYIEGSSGHYRKDEDTFEIYQSIWERYANGESQRKLLAELKEKGIKIGDNALSNFFKDPFYAGLYCYGDQIIDLRETDPKFTPMVNSKEFIMAQRENRKTSRKWQKAKEFRPFNDLVICSDCGSYMTAGLSKGHNDYYLNITCCNEKCRESNRMQGIKPIANTVRGKVILEFAINLISKGLDISEKLYNDAKKKYLESRNTLIAKTSEEIKGYKIKLTKLQSKEIRIKDKLLEVQDPIIIQRLSNDIKILIKEIHQIEKEIKRAEIRRTEYRADIELDFPSYSDFVNFFKNAVETLINSEDNELKDEIVKLVFVNIFVDKKKVVKYTLHEPFATYNSLKFLSGVEDGT